MGTKKELKIEHILHESKDFAEKLVIKHDAGLGISYWYRFGDGEWKRSHDEGAFIPEELLPKLGRLITQIQARKRTGMNERGSKLD